MSKQDGYSSRTAVDLERKYNFGKTFAEVYDLVSEAQRAAQEAQNAFDGLNQEQIFNLLTNFGESQGIYRDDNGDVYVNASYIKGGTIKGDSVKVEAATITGQLVATQIDTKDLKVLAANITGQLTAGQIDATNLKVSAANITGALSIGQLPDTVATTDDIPTDYVTESGVTTIVNGVVTTDYVNALGISVAAANVTGTLTASQIATNAISWSKLSSTVQGYIEDAEAAAYDASETVGGWRYNGGTYIDGSMIKAGTVMASQLLGGYVGLLTDDEDEAGGISITGSSSSTFAIELYSEGALRLVAGYGAVWLEDGSGATLGLSEGEISAGSTFYPNSKSSFDLGKSTYKWDNIYAVTCNATTSDQNEKHDIEDLPDKYVAMFDLLRPVRYKLNNGTSGRYHVGYIAQEVKAAMDAVGISDTEFGGWLKDVDEDGNDIYMLRYDEYDPIRDAKIKQLEARVTKLEEKTA